jgi:hypothetical protein
VLAGVAGGVADHLGVRVLWVRIALIVLLSINGSGRSPTRCCGSSSSRSPPRPAAGSGRDERQQAFGLIALALAAG